MDKLVEVDAQYREWISEVSKRFHQSQIKAAVKVNDEMLRFYWQLGKELHDRKDKFSYGQSFYKTISRDLRRELPDVKSFSETNLRYMQKFAELYSEVSNLPQLGEDFRSEEIEPLFAIPWGHHKIIIDKCNGNPKKALFFVNQVIQNNWSRAVLLNFLDTDLYERQGKAITNFNLTLPAMQSDLAQEITKDPYKFDFITLTQSYNEKELKDALMDNIQNAVFPAISASGTKIHIGNAFVVLSAYLLGGVYGGLSGAVGLSIADIVGGYAASAPRTFITKLVIGLIVGFVAHRIAKLSDEHDHAYVIRWSAIAAVCGLGFNCFFEPALKYVWYTLLFPNADKAASAIKALIAITTYTTIINAVINSVIAVVLYAALRPALKRAGFLAAQ